MNIKYFILALFFIPVAFAIETNLTSLCVNNQGNPCDSSVYCEAQIFDDDFNVLVPLQNMTFISNGYYNITIDLSVGTYPAKVTCTDTSGRRATEDTSFRIGSSLSMWELAVIIGTGFIGGFLLWLSTTFRTRSAFQLLFFGIGMSTLMVMSWYISLIANINGQSAIESIASSVWIGMVIVVLAVVGILMIEFVYTTFKKFGKPSSKMND